MTYRSQHTVTIDDKADFYDFFTPMNPEVPEIHGGFVRSTWCGSGDCEARIKDDLAVTIRCLPSDVESHHGACIYCGKPGTNLAIFAKAY
jgi:prolyl-tRNA synthetase